MDSTDFSDTNWLKRFPKDSCDITSKLLGLYFFDNGLSDFEIMRGTLPGKDSDKHHWLQFGHIDVDITADQFDGENQPAVIIARYSPWHLALDGHTLKQFDHDYYRQLMESDQTQFFRDMYTRILTNIEPSP